MCLAQGHNTVTPVGIEPRTSRFGVRRSTTTPSRSLLALGFRLTINKQLTQKITCRRHADLMNVNREIKSTNLILFYHVRSKTAVDLILIRRHDTVKTGLSVNLKMLRVAIH